MLKTQSRETQVILIRDLYRHSQDLTEFLLFRKKRSHIWVSVGLVLHLKALSDKPLEGNISNYRTVFQAIEFIHAILKQPVPQSEEWEPAYKVLTVEEDPQIRQPVINAFRLLDIQLDIANNPERALDQIRHCQYRLLILDFEIPPTDGPALLAKFREIKAYKETPIILVTALDGFESRMRASQADGNDIIGKPFLPEELAVKAMVHLLTMKT